MTQYQRYPTVVILLIGGCLLWVQLAYSKSGTDKPTGCRYEARTEGGFLAAETICLAWGALGVERAIADGNTLKVSIEKSLADSLKKGETFAKKTATNLAETFARLSGNRVKSVRVEFLRGGKLLLAAEGSDGSMKFLTKGKEGTVATNCEKLIDSIPKQPFSERDQEILNEVLRSSEPEEQVHKRMAKKYGITPDAAKEAAGRAQQGQFSGWGLKRDNAVKKAVRCFVKHQGLRLLNPPMVTGGYVTMMVNSGRLAIDVMQPLAQDILRLPGIASVRIDLRHNKKRVAIRDYP